MERNGTVGLFLCFVLALLALIGLGYYAYTFGGLHVDEGRTISDDIDRAKSWAEVRQ